MRPSAFTGSDGAEGETQLTQAHAVPADSVQGSHYPVEELPYSSRASARRSRYTSQYELLPPGTRAGELYRSQSSRAVSQRAVLYWRSSSAAELNGFSRSGQTMFWEQTERFNTTLATGIEGLS